jgi:hypothetical protein
VKGRPLLGRSVITPSGAEEVFSFEIYALPLPQESAKRSTTITTYACFPYETFQTASVCIDFDPYQNIAPKGVKRVCELKDVSAATGGGPINVGTIQTRIEKSPEGDLLPSFYFNIAASSSFKFFALGSQDAFCDSRQIRAEVHDTVYFSAALSDQFLVCDGVDLVPGYQNTYSVTLVNNKAKIMCSSSNQLFTYGNEAPSNYLAPLTINMTYGVVSTASRTITINAMS